MKLVLGEFLNTVCNRYSQRACIYFPTTETSYTYDTFNQYVQEIAKSLIALSLKKGDLIAIKSVNTPEWLALQWAAFKIGVIVVGLNAKLTPKEVDYAMSHTEAKLLFTDDTEYILGEEKAYRVIIWDEANTFLVNLGRNIKEHVVEERQREVCSEDIALILFTSGTTSNPKAVMMKNGAILRALSIYRESTNYTSEDHALVCSPFSHILGSLYSILPVFEVGGKLTILERFNTKRVLETIEREKCTIFDGVPTMFLFLLDAYKDYNISSLRAGLIVGSSVSKELYTRIHNELGMSELINSFGQTEALAISRTDINDPLEKKALSCGKAYKGVEVSAVDPKTLEFLPKGEAGELVVKSPYKMIGYLKNEEATKKAVDHLDWLHTGDLGYVDEEGYVFLTARLKDIIIRSGENISPVEIEEAMMSLEEVKEVSVVGVPDTYSEEKICAFIIPNHERPIDVEGMKQKLSVMLAKYKIPKYIIRIKDFPRTSSGKIKKTELKFIYEIIKK